MVARIAWSVAAMTLLLMSARGVAAGKPADLRATEALARPAVAVNAPQRVVLLSAARAGDRLVAVGEHGVVVLSDDDGERWRQASVPVSVSLTAVRFADATHGFVTGHGGVVLATSDGGQTWTKVLDGVVAAALVKAASAGDERAARDAERLVAEGPDKPLLDLAVLDAGHVVVIGAYGLAFRTEDGGRSWQSFGGRLPNPKGLHLYAIRMRGDAVWIAGEQGLVLRSEDGGKTFQAVDAGYAGTWFTAELPNEREILLAGLRGHVRRSVDGGATWASVELPVPATVTSSWLDKDGRVLLASQSGTAFVEAEGRVDATNLQLPPLNALASLGRGRVLALTMQGLLTVPFVTVPSGTPR